MFLRFSVCFTIILGFLTVLPARSQELTPYYLTLGAVIQSDYEFAGDLNDRAEEGNGYYTGAGKELSDMLNLELAYTDINNYSSSSGTETEARLIELSGIARFNQGAAVIPYVRLGVYHTTSDRQNTAGIEDSGFLYGVGFDYEFSEGKAIRLDFTPGSVGGDDLDRLMIGMIISLGD